MLHGPSSQLVLERRAMEGVGRRLADHDLAVGGAGTTLEVADAAENFARVVRHVDERDLHVDDEQRRTCARHAL
jgi:hypothetical protein